MRKTMSRDKQIEEMAKILCTDCDMGKCMVDGFECLKGYCSKRERIEDLYNAGYRKASEVAEEIFAEIDKEYGENCGAYRIDDLTYGQLWDYLAELKKKYTKQE